MSLAHEYYAAAIPEPYRVLGVALRPFSLGHKIILGRINSPFETGGVVGIEDLALAVLFCSESYERCIEMLDDPGLHLRVTEWADAICFKKRWFGLLAEPVEIDWVEKAQLFQKYIEAHSVFPQFSYDEKRGSGGNIPLPQVVKVTLLSKVYSDLSLVMNMPWGLALWDYVTVKANEGLINIEDREDIEELKKQAAEFAESVKINGIPQFNR